jgi:hypothetical protein
VQNLVSSVFEAYLFAKYLRNERTTWKRALFIVWALNFNPTQPQSKKAVRSAKKAPSQSSIQGSEHNHFSLFRERVVRIKAYGIEL